MKRSFIVFVVVIGFATLVPGQCDAQKLKLPNFLPFKKKTKEVQPFQLSDQAADPGTTQRIEGMAQQNHGVFDFLKPRNEPSGKPNALSGFNDRSKAFFDKTGQDIGKFTEGTRQFFSEAWNPPKAKTAWWNRESGDSLAKKPLFPWQKSAQPNAVQPPPQPRTARQYQNGKPRFRF